MPITIVCPECDKSLRLRDDLAGKRIRCPGCQEVVTVPAASKSASSRPAAANKPKGASKPQESRPKAGKSKPKAVAKTQPVGKKRAPVKKKTNPGGEPAAATYNKRYESFLAAFKQEEIEPVPIAGTYRFAILLVCLFMLSLPFMYLGSVLLLSFLFPCVMLPLSVLLIIKPIFSSMGPPTGKRTLDRDDEPLLFDFVDRICEAVNAPYPREINIDSQVNASASFRRGVLSMFGSDLTLTIGMPLVAGLNTRQLAGVLAHEFGHFSQGAGMRLSYFIRFVSMWFMRVVYERDRIDEWLEMLSHELPLPLCLVFFAIRGLVWVARRLMWCFMMLGHLVSGYMLRQMEFDADRYEARLSGTRCFAQTQRQILHMTIAHQGALSDLGDFYKEGRLADNLPRLVVANVEQLDEKARQKIRKIISKTETSVFDTHPCDRDRVESARDEATNGIFRVEQPAEQLFRRYQYQAKAVTWDMYKAIFGDKLKKKDIHPVEQLLHRQRYQQENYKALFRFFQCAPSWYRPLSTPGIALKPPQDVKQTIAKVKTSRQKMIDTAPRYQMAWKKYDKADTRQLECELAESLLKARLSVPKDLFKVPLGNYDDIERRLDAADYIQSKQEPYLAPFEDAAAARLYSALRLLRDPTMQRRLEHHEALTREVDELVELFGHVNGRLGQLLQIRNDQIVLGLLISMLEGNDGNRQLLARIFDTMNSLHDLIHDLSEVLAFVPYPFDHASEDMTVAEFMLPELPEEENPIELYEAAGAIGESLPAIQTRVLGRMCQIAEIVETSLGLETLPQPDLDDDEEDEDEDN